VSITVDDADGIIRDLLNDEETAYWDGREVEICLLSDEGLEAGLDPFVVFRGRIDGLPTLSDDRAVTFEVVDFVGSKFSAFDLEQDLAIPIGDEHENLPAGLEAYYNIIYGEHSDLGSKDQNGAAVDKGLIPGTFVGMYDIGGGTPSPTLPPAIPPPTNLKANVVGGGDSNKYYAASVITPHGESMISDVLKVSNAPTTEELGLSNYVALSCDFDAGAGNVNKVRWWGRYTDPPVGFLDSGFYDYGEGETQPDKSYYNDGSHPAPNPSRNDVDHVKKRALPKSGAIALPPVDTIWGMVVVAIGEVSILGTPYASDLAEETQAKRIPLPASLEGSEYILPTSPQWPFATPYLEKTNSEGVTIRFTAILFRGARLTHHIDGQVTIAFRVCGYKGENGQLIDQAFLQLQHFLNEFVVKDGGTGYRSGAWGPLETFTNGDPMLWTRRFQEAQNASKGLMGDTVGFQGAWCVNEPLTLREFLQRFCVSFGCLFGISHHGQAFPVLPSTTVPLTTGRLYRYPYDLESVPLSAPINGNRYNRVWYTFDWDSDMHEYRTVDNMVENLASQDAHGTQNKKTIYEPTESFELFCTRYPQTAAVAMANFVLCYRKSPVHTTLSPLDLTGLHDELGDRIRYEHWNSPRPSTTTQVMILRHSLNIMPGEEGITIIAWDMTRAST
jgi:hypothetical protein